LKVAEEYFQKKSIPFIPLLTDKNGDDTKPSIKSGMVTVSTIHRAKGLEWQVVFIVGLGDYFFPCHMNNNMKNIEEERRLFYVGITIPKQYLYFVENQTQLPISRFIAEIYDLINFKNFSNLKDITRRELFETNDLNDLKLIYPVTDISKLLQGPDIKRLRDLKLIPDAGYNVRNLFEGNFLLNDQIKGNYLEADFGDFCDRVITRQISLNSGSSKQSIRDYDTEFIINSTILNEEEMEVFNEYDLMSVVLESIRNRSVGGDSDLHDIVKDELVTEEMLKKVVGNTKKLKIAMSVCNKINPIYDVVRDNTYPKHFMNTLKLSYQDYIRLNQQNEQIMKSIYYVSLCRRFNSERRRLLYRDVFDVFMKDFDPINARIKEYSRNLKTHRTLCKVMVQYLFRQDKNSIRVCGEVDMIDQTESMIIDFKCSDSPDCKIDWIVQVLLYYAILVENQSAIQWDISKIKNVGIFNIMNGKQYEFEIPEEYNHKAMIEFARELIGRDINGERDCEPDIIDLPSLEAQSESQLETQPESQLEGGAVACTSGAHVVKVEKNGNPKNYICFDVETGDHGENDDIVQIAYEVYDGNMVLIKSINKYIKDRLQEDGEEFKDVIGEFLIDLNSARYVVGHNVRTDIDHVVRNMERYNVKLSNGSPFDGKVVECTMKMGMPVCQLKNKIGRLKAPKLGELYETLYCTEMKNAHDASYDVKYTWHCYRELLRRKKRSGMKRNVKSIEDFLI
jgi:DNA polymerase III epsilon subunit-like protein